MLAQLLEEGQQGRQIHGQRELKRGQAVRVRLVNCVFIIWCERVPDRSAQWKQVARLRCDGVGFRAISEDGHI